jgi:hypothetical protein
MNSQDYIEIRIEGKKGNIILSPDNFDINEIRQILEVADRLFSSTSKTKRPTISYSIENGSVIHRFYTTFQLVLQLTSVLSFLISSLSIEHLEYETQKSIDELQRISIKSNYKIKINTSEDKTNILEITPDTKLFQTKEKFVNAEFYFYGETVRIGGKDKTSIQLNTENFGVLTIHTTRAIIEKIENNPLYKTIGLRASGLQNINTGEFDKQNLNLIELQKYEPKFDPVYLNGLIEKGKSNWADIGDPDEWLRDLRGNYAC